MKVHVLIGISFGLVMLLGGCKKSETAGITYTDYYVNAPVSKNTVAAGYITFVNGKKDLVKLVSVSVSSDIAEKTSIHGHELHDGMMKMYEVESLDLPPGVPVKLYPGGYHIMFMGLKKSLALVSYINVSFHFSDGENLNINMTVRSNVAMSVHDGPVNQPINQPVISSNQCISIENAYVRATMPSMKSTAVYMTIENKGAKELSLVEVKCSIAKKVELHTVEMDGGMMKMRQMKSIEIKDGQNVVLKPGGYHIILDGLKKPILEGETVPVELKFSDRTKISLKVRALKKAPIQAMHI